MSSRENDNDPQTTYEQIGKGAQRLADGMEKIGSGILKDTKALGSRLWDKSGDFASAASEGARNFADSAKKQGSQLKVFFQDMVGNKPQQGGGKEKDDR